MRALQKDIHTYNTRPDTPVPERLPHFQAILSHTITLEQRKKSLLVLLQLALSRKRLLYFLLLEKLKLYVRRIHIILICPQLIRSFSSARIL